MAGLKNLQTEHFRFETEKSSCLANSEINYFELFKKNICFFALCFEQYSEREGDSSDLPGSQHPHWPVSVHAAHSAAVDPQAGPLRPLPLHCSHVARWQPDGRSHVPAA